MDLRRRTGFPVVRIEHSPHSVGPALHVRFNNLLYSREAVVDVK